MHLIPTLEGGGAEKQLAMLSNELSIRGYDVHIALRRGGVNLNLLNDKIKVHYLGDYKSIDPRIFFNILKLLDSIRPDLIQTWLIQMDIFGGLISIIKRTPWIMTERTSSEAYSGRPFTSFIRLYLANKAKFIIANSKEGLKTYIGINCSKLKVISNAVDINAVRKASLLKHTKMGKNTYILSVGRLSHEKNHKILIEAISRLDTSLIKLDIFGEGSLHDELQDLIYGKKLENIITIKPYNKDWWKLLKKADMLVSMSYFEGSPNVVLESMAGKCPLVLSSINEHIELLDDRSALFSPPNDAKSLSIAIKNVIDNKADAKERSEFAFNVSQKFNIWNTADEYDKLYNEII